jgi:hypothetical protein
MVIIRTDTSPELWQIVLDVLVALGRAALSSSTLPLDPAVRGVGCGTQSLEMAALVAAHDRLLAQALSL